MRVVLQRVKNASVTVDQEVVGQINRGLLIFVGITEDDNDNDIDWLVSKIVNLRIFSDDQGKMNIGLKEINGEVLIVSQFTLYASVKKGNRPSYLKSAKPDVAIPLYDKFVQRFRDYSLHPEEGIFGADMSVSLNNDGPVTITMDSKNKE